MPRDELSDLDVIARSFGFTPSPETLERFRSYLDVLTSWNRVQRLTALRERAQIARGLLADSLLFLEALPKARPLAIVDIGSGAGIPGIPLRIIDPRLCMTLVEAKRKRVSFLKTVARELNLESGLSILEGRAERLIETNPALQFDIAIARAAMPIERLAPIAMRWLRIGGELIVSGSPLARQSNRSPVEVELRMVAVAEAGLTRTFAVIEKKAQSA